MKSFFLPTLFLLTALIAAVPSRAAAQPAPEQEQASGKVQFSCGQAGDPSSKQNLPATVANVEGNPETVVLIVWKSEFFGTNYTPEKRCGVVSAAIGKAFSEGRTYLGSGTDKATGLGLVCGVANPEQKCDRTNMLLTMKSYQNADDTIDQLAAVMQGKTGQPVYQSSGGKRVNLRALLLKRRVR
jgi:opacity protein-like surface antigen